MTRVLPFERSTYLILVVSRVPFFCIECTVNLDKRSGRLCSLGRRYFKTENKVATFCMQTKMQDVPSSRRLFDSFTDRARSLNNALAACRDENSVAASLAMCYVNQSINPSINQSMTDLEELLEVQRVAENVVHRLAQHRVHVDHLGTLLYLDHGQTWLLYQEHTWLLYQEHTWLLCVRIR